MPLPLQIHQEEDSHPVAEIGVYREGKKTDPARIAYGAAVSLKVVRITLPRMILLAAHRGIKRSTA